MLPQEHAETARRELIISNVGTSAMTANQISAIARKINCLAGLASK
ncbi:predicted protein [Botrytis cinerea T4]|uniref:Uncharacterized protein n=1 Tax=Botryotinia fuckeliana (strain T4) TaxID=999810 RepID=G2XVN0_BOTF4|nr:predicted protein [Botrytis cinerea T4]